jgi:hypothetical protein
MVSEKCLRRRMNRPGEVRAALVDYDHFAINVA